MRRVLRVLKSNKGMVLIYSAFFLTAALGLTALAVDVGYIYVVSNELKSVADSGALTAAAAYLSEMRSALERGDNLADPGVIAVIIANTRNTTDAMIFRGNILSADADITSSLEFGQYDTNSSQPYNEITGALFTDRTDALTAGTVSLKDISAFRVTVGRTGTGVVQTFFAKIFGISSLSFTRNSVSVFAPRNFMVVIDSSGSMDDMTYPRTTTLGPEGIVSLPDTVWPAGESFISRPSNVPGFPILYSPYAPAPEPRIAGFDPPRLPEPLQTVLNSSLEFLKGLISSAGLGDRAGVYYFATHASAKKNGSGDSMIPVSQENVDDFFEPLLTNHELYLNFGTAQPPIALSNGNVATTAQYIYNGAAAYDPVLEQYDGPIAIPQGHTNIGDAILYAVDDVNAAAIASKSISVVILFTDGMPDCAPVGGEVACFGTGATPEQWEAARNYTLQQAQLAIGQNIRIYPITYGNLGGGAEASKAQLLFDTIAQLSGLENHFHIPDTSDPEAISASLQTIFDTISLFVPFSLAG